MTSMTREMINTLLNSRVEIAFDKVSESTEYLSVCKQQGKAKNTIDKLFERFTEDEKQTIQQYTEGETHKQNFEIKECYLQGLKDCFKLLSFLAGSESEVQL